VHAEPRHDDRNNDPLAATELSGPPGPRSYSPSALVHRPSNRRAAKLPLSRRSSHLARPVLASPYFCSGSPAARSGSPPLGSPPATQGQCGLHELADRATGGRSDCSSGDARRDLLLLLVGGRAWPNPAEAVLDYGCLEASKDAALAGSRVSLDVVDEDVHQYGGGVSVSAALIGRPELLELARGSSRPQGLMWTTSAVQLPIRGSRAAQNCVWWATSLSVPVDTAS
jgi:hypothetical protein